MTSTKRDYKAEYLQRKLKVKALLVSKPEVTSEGVKPMIQMTTNNRGYQYMPKIAQTASIEVEKHKQVDRNLKIKKLVEGNPRRQDSGGWHSWNKIKEDMTIAEYLKAGGRIVDLMWDLHKKFIEFCN